MRIALTQNCVISYTELRGHLHRDAWLLTQNCVICYTEMRDIYTEMRGVNGVGDTILAPVLLFCQRCPLALCTLTDYGQTLENQGFIWSPT